MWFWKRSCNECEKRSREPKCAFCGKDCVMCLYEKNTGARSKKIHFNDVHQQIVNAIYERGNNSMLQVNEKLSLCFGFINPNYRKEINNDLIIGGDTIPMVIIVGEESGQVYPFALYALLPHLKDEKE